MRKLFFSLGLILAAALACGTYYAAVTLNAGSGFAAKNLCSGHFLSGMPAAQIETEALLSASPLLAYISYSIDERNRRVDTRAFGFFHRRAVYADGTGCTLLVAGAKQLLRRVKTRLDDPPGTERPWPHGLAPVAANARLEAVLKQAFAEPDRLHQRNTKAVVVIHNGQLVAERYAAGVDAGTPLLGWSMTKSVINLLIGILVKDGRLSLAEPAPVPLWHKSAGDPRGAITIDQLLRMSSGLKFEEKYGLYSDVTQMLSAQPDAAEFAADKPVEAAPGSRWSYSSGTSNILSGIIKRTLGGSLQDYYEFAQRRLFIPLGIHSAILEPDYSGTFIGSSYMYASARDWAILGQFCLQQGQWAGEQLLPARWIHYSTTPAPSNPGNYYGAHFWLNANPEDRRLHRTWPGVPADAFSMNGYQGQRVIVVPSKSLVVVRLGFSAGKNRGIEPLVSGLIKALAN